MTNTDFSGVQTLSRLFRYFVLISAATLITDALPVSGQVFNVSTNADSGAGSLRDAITSANAYTGAATINFNSSHRYDFARQRVA